MNKNNWRASKPPPRTPPNPYSTSISHPAKNAHRYGRGSIREKATGQTLWRLLVHSSFPRSIHKTASPRSNAPNHGTLSPDSAGILFGLTGL
uniref:Uncharacterized protein n=1 Tax=Phlebotomus papatasi TaxID=29031 RepID=A0A1B0D857_PHLPP